MGGRAVARATTAGRDPSTAKARDDFSKARIRKREDVPWTPFHVTSPGREPWNVPGSSVVGSTQLPKKRSRRNRDARDYHCNQAVTQVKRKQRGSIAGLEKQDKVVKPAAPSFEA